MQHIRVLGVALSSVHVGNFPFLGGKAATTEDALVHGVYRMPEANLEVLWLGCLDWGAISVKDARIYIMVNIVYFFGTVSLLETY